MLSVIIRSIIFSSLTAPAFALTCIFFGKALFKGESFDPMVFLLYPFSVLVGSFVAVPLSILYGLFFYVSSSLPQIKTHMHNKAYACSLGGIISLLIGTGFTFILSRDLLLSLDSLIYIIPSVFCGALIPLILKQHAGRSVTNKYQIWCRGPMIWRTLIVLTYRTLTSGSSRSLRSLGRAKARPLTKR